MYVERKTLFTKRDVNVFYTLVEKKGREKDENKEEEEEEKELYITVKM